MSCGPGFVIADINLALRLFEEDLTGTRSLHQEVLGLPLTFEYETAAVFELENMMVCLTDVSAAPELIAPSLVANAEAASRSCSRC